MDAADYTDHSQDSLSMALGRELRTGERVVWQGRPIRRLSLKSFGMYAFAIPWTAFALFWTAMASLGVGSAAEEDVGILVWAFPLFGVPFILIGLAMLAMPFAPLFTGGRVLYAATNQRLIELSLWRSLNVKSVPARRIGMIDRSERRDGSGTLKIAIAIGTDSDGDKTIEHLAIGEIPDVKRVHEIIAEIGRRALEAQNRPAWTSP